MKNNLKIVALLTILIVAMSQFSLTIGLVAGANQDLDLINYNHIPLTNEEINVAWPKLPTAKQLYDEGDCLIYDSRYSGKKVSSMDQIYPDTSSPTVIPMSNLVSNYTSTDIGALKNQLTTNSAHIWLQYNASVWVLVPQIYLETPQKSSLTTTTLDVETWAIGLYENPNDIAGGASVTGVASVGRFVNWNPSMDNAYVFHDILTMRDTTHFYQIGMVTIEGVGHRINVEKWTAAGTMVFSYDITETIQVGTAYNEYIQYENGQWHYYWDFTYMYSTGAGSSQLVMGNQATAVVESNDFEWDDFDDYNVMIGGITTVGGIQYYMPAAAFLYNGNWVPRVVGDDVPATYAYHGGTQLGTWGFVGDNPPPVLGWGTFGMVTFTPERLWIGAGYSRPNHGSLLWAAQ